MVTYTSLDKLKPLIGKYVVFSYNKDYSGNCEVPHKCEQWIMRVKRIAPSPTGQLYGSKVHGYYICRIYPTFKTYHMPSKRTPEKKLIYYTNAQNSFREATEEEIKHLHEFWSKSRLQYWAFAEKKAKEDWEYKQRFNL
jgi:hypothetical protein